MSIHKTNKDIPFIRGEEIVEWDIKSANVSLMKYYHLCDDSVITRIEGMKKEEREIFVGKMMRKSKEFAINLEKSFDQIIKLFMTSNNLSDADIISYKKDAVFVRNKTINTSVFEDVKFIPKNIYDGCILLPKYEFYYNDSGFDVKGINDANLSHHENGMLAFLSNVIEESRSSIAINKFFLEYLKDYKRRSLLYDAYREFTNESKFRVNLFGNEVLMDNIDDELLESTSILYNYYNIVLPTLNALRRYMI